jgi:hypothetical protein
MKKGIVPEDYTLFHSGALLTFVYNATKIVSTPLNGSRKVYFLLRPREVYSVKLSKVKQNRNKHSARALLDKKQI